MEIKCECCGGDITDHAMGRSDLNCPHCGQLVNGFGQALATTYPEYSYAGEEYWGE